MKIRALVFALAIFNFSFSQCYFTVSANATSAFHTGDTIYGGNHHICLNSYVYYFSNNYDTLYLEDQVTLNILWSDHLVVYADTGCTINYTGSGNTQLLNVFYDSTVSYFDDANLNSWAINYCTGTNYNYSNMPTLPGQGCTLQNPTADMEEGITSETFPIVYPNPASDHFIVEVGHSTNLIIYNIAGKMVLEKNLIAGANYIHLSKFYPGLYFYSIGEQSLKKIVVQ
ncbi:MAG: T9SS type A sorting domain-containing protein [Crocinitomicaceae bacterium]